MKKRGGIDRRHKYECYQCKKIKQLNIGMKKHGLSDRSVRGNVGQLMEAWCLNTKKKGELIMLEHELELLSTLKDGPKYLHIGRSPVWAISFAFKMAENGIVTLSNDNWLSLTEEGHRLLNTTIRL